MGEEQKEAKIDFSLTKPNRYTFIFASAGVMTAVIHNSISRKILFQGIWRHIALGLAGAYVGTKYGIWGEVKHAERDFILKDYITRHPEHFQKPPVQLMGEQLDTFEPIR